MAIALWAVGLMIGLALIAAASNLGDSIRSHANSQTAIAETIEKLVPDRISQPSRTIVAQPGTRLAYVHFSENGLEVVYAPVLAFIETWTVWEPFALIGGAPHKSSQCYGGSERVLAPGQSLTDKECSELKEHYAATHPAEFQALTGPV